MKDPLLIDKDYWRREDEDWLAIREAQWPAARQLLGFYKPDTAMPVIEDFYPRGKLPSWRTLTRRWREYDETERHLDLFTLLWLHPSNEIEVLRELRDAYWTDGFGRTGYDVKAGFHILTHLGIELAAINGEAVIETKDDPPVERPVSLQFDADTEVLATVMFEKLRGTDFQFGDSAYRLLTPGMNSIVRQTDWLAHDTLTAYGSKMMLQHPEALRFCQIVVRADQKALSRQIKRRKRLVLFLRLCAGFQSDNPEDAPRVEFVEAVKRGFDEGSWPDELTALWSEVLAQ